MDFIKESRRVKQSCEALSITPTERVWIVSIPDQAMALVENDQISTLYTVSTSKNPPSCRANSFGTPTGLHQAADKIGDGEPSGMVFKGRVPTGRVYHEYPEGEQAANLITTRIIRMRGLEDGHNAGPECDSYDRYVYMHGTNHENRLGQPFSGGCIELSNRDVIEVFERIQRGDLIFIVN
ncbi:L,D-transpeptidase [Coraliomargarita parva]|uniref:L,D-transpeptidase n=1 Tax=Coraliomargarita parva TaxID=3014050 RepID=UPI0022B40993|nr:L,D-transpeptidase [Coraliomargarita parva]